MIKHKKYTISIGIVAYNEEQNITHLLDSIRAQTEKNYTIKEILICSDGSTDTTVKKIREFRDNRIKLIIGKKRIGKSHYLNLIFRIAVSPVIVLFDADVVLASKQTIENLIYPLVKDTHIGLVGGNPQPVNGTTFIENAVNASFRAYDPLRTKLRGGNNIWGCDGRILALSKKLTRSLRIPEKIFANDAFLYFSAVTSGYEFRHVRSAKVWFRSPATLTDQIRQNRRFVSAHYLLERIFGSVVPSAYAAPKRLLYQLMFTQFVKMPVHTLAIFFINLYCKFKAREGARSINAKWPIAVSTKGGIINE